MLDDLDQFFPARDLGRRRNKYFIGVLDPCASIEFTRGCPWDCSFCSAWTFYGRSYRKSTPEAAAEDMLSIKEPNVFIVDDVAFIHPEHGFAIGHEIEKRKIKKQYYLETRADVLCRNPEVFRYWRKLGMEYMFLGLEAIDEEGLKLHRKRSSMGVNFKALEVAREIGLAVAINLIADPSWDVKRFEVIREWALSIPEIVHLTVATPYPGTELWFTESRKLTTLDYRLYDIQHAVLPTKLPLLQFYQELVKTQDVLNRKHLGFAALKEVASIAGKLALKGQTNFLKMLWKFNSVYNAERQVAEHSREVKYAMRPPSMHTEGRPAADKLYIHMPKPSRPQAPAPAAAAAGEPRLTFRTGFYLSSDKERLLRVGRPRRLDRLKLSIELLHIGRVLFLDHQDIDHQFVGGHVLLTKPSDHSEYDSTAIRSATKSSRIISCTVCALVYSDRLRSASVFGLKSG